jgi:hypothetical protein
MFSLRQRIFIIISVVFGIIAIAIAGILITGRLKQNDSQTPDTTQQTGDQLPVAPNALIQQPGAVPPPSGVTQPSFSDDIPKERLARQVAELFVERFATRSNQNNNAHIDAVLPFVTETMAQWTQSQTVSQSGGYVGTRTDVVTTNVTAITDTTATVRIEATQLVEQGGTTQSTQKTGRVELVLDVNGVWKVSGFFWDR